MRKVEDADSVPAPEHYVFKDGLRMVMPYYFDFKFHVKQRMEAKSIIDIFAEEFPSLSRQYYEQAFSDGRIRAEGLPGISSQTPLRSGTCLRHFIHRHEPPVLAHEVQILGCTDDFVAVNKPASMPVHTAGQYRKNTVMGVLQACHPELQPLHPTHRLDKPVSGLLLLARSPAAANSLRLQLEGKELQKVYVARVAGRFPHAEIDVDVPLSWDSKANHVTAVPDAVVVDEEDEQGPRAGRRHKSQSDPKSALTHFKLLSVAPDGLSSLVECRPRTGRTHQIRVHLQHLGHPIGNDTQYGGTLGRGVVSVRNFFKRPAVDGVGALGGEGVGKRPRNTEDLSTEPHQTNGSDATTMPPPAQPTTHGPAAMDAVHDPGDVSLLRASTSQASEPAAAASCELTQPPTGPEQMREAGADLARQPTGPEQGHEANPGNTSPHGSTAPDHGEHTPGLEDARAATATGSHTAGPMTLEYPTGNVSTPGAATSAATQEQPPLTSQTHESPANGERLSAEAAPAEPGHHNGLLDAREAGPQSCTPGAAAAGTVARKPEDAGTRAVAAMQFQVDAELVDPQCVHCPHFAPSDYPLDLQPLWLHAYSYSSATWSFEAPLPAWAQPGWTLQDPA